MSEFTHLREAVDTLASRTPSPDFDELKRRATHRGHRRVGLVAAATAAVLAGSVAALSGLGDDPLTAPVEQPRLVVRAAAVWYDAQGLHRGDIVEQTPVQLVQPEKSIGPDMIRPARGALALVRSGAVYLDPATGDVWFHPWGGEPRIVGHNSEAGPGGDPNGDTAVWFEDGQLVVYDTAVGRDISRTSQSHSVTDGQGGIGGDHFPAGNGFLQVSTERIVWTSGTKTYSHDVRTQSTSELNPPKGRYLLDVHDNVELFGNRGVWQVVLKVPGRAETEYSDLETHLRLSPSGNFVFAVESTETRHAAAIVDTRTGELWRVPRNAYPWIAWAYGDIAMVDTDGALLACDAARRECERVDPEGTLLLPTN